MITFPYLGYANSHTVTWQCAGMPALRVCISFNVVKSVNQNQLDFLTGHSSWNRKVASVNGQWGANNDTLCCRHEVISGP